MQHYSRRSAIGLLGGTALAAPWVARAAGKSVTIGMDFSITGSDAESSIRARDGALMAIEDFNANGGPGGYHLNTLVLDDGTATAGQYDPAQAATNARKLVADKTVVACVGPQSSTPGKAMSPIFSQGDLATLTPSSTNPDITDPKFAAQYRPKGPAIYFRLVTTDAYQGPNLANYMVDTLKLKSMYGLDDSGAYGIGIALAFEDQAKKRGMQVLGHDKLDPRAADYTAILTKIKSLNPDLLYYGGDTQAGVKVAKQGYEIIPKVVKAGGDGIYGPSMLTGAGFPAADGWYATVASPHIMEEPSAQDWVKRFAARTGTQPSDYSITCYDCVWVIADAIKRVAAAGKPVNRVTVRDAIQATKLKTLQGEVSFDANGDLNQRIVAVFQVKHDTNYAPDDILHQYKYIGVAPAIS
jgi:branched-chain amino acid transport system substrate-binding protein